MAENLKTTRYADGTAISLVTVTGEWDALSAASKAYCWYNNSTTQRDTYGGLYTWAAAVNGSAGSDANPSGVQGVCPAGWHVPSDAEWKDMEKSIGMSQAEADATGNRGVDEGGKLKEEGTGHWSSPNTLANNSSGFSAIPGGYRDGFGTFGGVGVNAGYWTATQYSSSFSWIRGLGYDNANIYRDDDLKVVGYSVRCLKD